MPRGRMIDKRIGESQKLPLVSDKAKVVYFMMLPHLDKNGSYKAISGYIKWTAMQNLDYSYRDIENALQELDKAKLIVLYKVNEQEYLRYIKFREFQTNDISREGKTDIPDPPDDLLQSYSAPTPELLQTQVKDKDKAKGKEEENISASAVEAFLLSCFHDWNDFAKGCGLREVRSLSPDRKKHLRERYKNPDFRDNFQKVLEEVKRSSFLTGKNDRGWKIDFDFLIRNDENYHKILEGKYRDSEKDKRDKGEEILAQVRRSNRL